MKLALVVVKGVVLLLVTPIQKMAQGASQGHPLERISSGEKLRKMCLRTIPTPIFHFPVGLVHVALAAI